MDDEEIERGRASERGPGGRGVLYLALFQLTYPACKGPFLLPAASGIINSHSHSQRDRISLVFCT